MAKIQRGDIPRPLLEHLLLRVRERDIDEAVLFNLWRLGSIPTPRFQEEVGSNVSPA
jgi:hypothetical protein